MGEGGSEIEIPDVDVASYVSRARPRARREAGADRRAERPHDHLRRAGRARRRLRRRAGLPAGSARATRFASTCRTSPSTRSPSTAPRRPAAVRRPPTPSTQPASCNTRSRIRKRASCSRSPTSSTTRRRRPRPPGSRRSSSSARAMARLPCRAAGRSGRGARRLGDRPGRGPRRAALFERHDRPAKGRDADPPQPRRQHRPGPGLQSRSAKTTSRSAVLPFFHIYGQTVIMNQGLRVGATIVTMPRFDLEQFLELIAEHKVTRTFVVPPIALALAKHPAIDDARSQHREDDHVGRGCARGGAAGEGRRSDRRHRLPGLRDDRD